MKKLHYLLTLLVFFTVLFTACKKDDDDPKPTTGSIKAMISPPNSATNMRLTQGSTTLEITPSTSGVFQADNLAPGDYSVTFTPATGFQAPPARTANVTAGNTTDLGTITLTQPANQFLGSFSASVNGTPWNSVIHGATLDGSDLTITGSVPNLTGATELIVLNIININGPGTFTGPNNATAIFTSASIGGGAQNTWASANSCTITVTKFDQVNQKISGTFSFTANPIPGSTASGTKTVTNGTFTNLNIQ